MKKKCIIISAGDFYEKEIVKNKEDLLIICDAGLNNYKCLDYHNYKDIDVLIGDFDSLVLTNEVKSNIKNIIKLNPIKDDSDTLDAIKLGFEKGYSDFYLYGMLGKRFEHSLANISCLSYIKERNGNAIIIDRDKITTAIKNERIEFDESYVGYISVFSLITESSGVTIHNMKYELKDYTIIESNPIGLDNEFIGKKSYIEVKNGKLLLIYNKKYGQN